MLQDLLHQGTSFAQQLKTSETKRHHLQSAIQDATKELTRVEQQMAQLKESHTQQTRFDCDKIQ